MLWLFSCSERYDNHFYSQRNNATQEIATSGDFSFSGEILVFPNTQKEQFLLNAIDNAKNKIFIEIYTFTKNEKIFQSLLNAKNRGVDVRILLEWAVYGNPSINVTAWKFFKENNIPVKYTDNNRYTFTHAKFWIIDEQYFISTGNWTRSFFDKNREYIYTGWDQTTRNFLEKIFEKDYNHEGFVQLSDIPPHIVISPLNSRDKIENFIKETKKEIFVYVQSVTDEKILQELEKLHKNGVKVSVCTAKNEWNQENFQKYSFQWKMVEKPYLHAKIMLRDDNWIFLWSQNFTTNSLENNREMGIIGNNRSDLYQKILKNFSEHCGL